MNIFQAVRCLHGVKLKRRQISLSLAGSKTCSEVDTCIVTGVSLRVMPAAEKSKCDPSRTLALAVASSILFNVN